MKKDISFLDIIGLSVIGIQIILLILNIDNLPADQKDWSYHLMIGRMFVDHQSLLWDYYEFAPIGRPNLYPPFLHFLFAGSNLIGMSWVFIQKFYGVLIYLLSLLCVFFVSRDLFGKKVGVLSVVILSASYSYWWWQISIAPTSLIFALFPLAMWSVYRKKTILSIALLSIFLWTHFSGLLVVLGVAVFGLLKRDYLKNSLKVIGVSLLLFSPWAVHVILNRDWMHGNWSSIVNMPTFGVLTIIFSILGIFFLAKRRDVKDILILSTVPSIVLIGILYGFRFFMHAPVILAILMAVGAYETSKIINKNAFYVFLIAFLIISYTGEPALRLNGIGGQPGGMNPPSQFAYNGPPPLELNQIERPNGEINPVNQPSDNRDPRKQMNPAQAFGLGNMQSTPLKENINALRNVQNRSLTISPYLSENAFALYNFLKNNTEEDEIIHVQGGPIATCISLFTDRRTDNGMWREVTNEDMEKSPSTNLRFGVIEMNNERQVSQIPESIIIEKFGQFIVYDATKSDQIRMPQQQYRIPPALTELSTLFRKASINLESDKELTKNSLLEASAKINQLSKGAPDDRGIRILERSSVILRNKAQNIAYAPDEDIQKIREDLIQISRLYERGDIGGALIILERI